MSGTEAWLAEQFEAAFEDEPGGLGDWDDVIRRAAPRKERVVPDVARGTRGPALDGAFSRVRGPRRRRLLLAALLAAGLVPAAVLADRAWDLVVGSPAPVPVQQALGGLQRLPARVSRSLRLDPAQTRVVARVDSTRGPVYLLAGPTVPRRVERKTGPRAGVCTALLFGFPIEAPSEKVVIAGRPFWFNSLSCGGKAPARIIQAGGWQLVDEHLAVGYGHLANASQTVEIVRADGSHSTAPTWQGYFVVVQADDGLAPGRRPVDIVVRDGHGRALSHPFLGEFARPLPSLSPHPSVGTSVDLARVFPSGRVLGPATVLRVQPRVLAVEVFNGGSLTIHTAVELTVTINGHVYRRAVRDLIPGVPRTVRLQLPGDLLARTVISAETAKLPGEGNPRNNRQTWRIRIQA